MSAQVAENITKYRGIAPAQVITAVKKAAARTGADFSFLMEKASTESSFNPAAKARKSSATGLFQFIESTWLNMVKQHGAKYGLGALADKIEVKDGKACVSDCAVKNQILDLRKNPEISALMAGEFSASNKTYLENNTACDVGSTELYLAHFLGASGGAKFINAREENGSACAADIFPQAARVNKNIFFDKATGKPRTLDEIYDKFANKFNTDGAIPSKASASLAPSTADTALSTAPALAPLGQAPSSSRKIAHTPPSNVQKISPASIFALSMMMDALPESGFTQRKDRYGYNS